MSWKCPVCGNPENLDESLRCICDHKIQPNDIEKYKVEPGIIEEYSDENKQGCGTRKFHLEIRSLQVLSLIAFATFGFFTRERVAAVVTPLCLALLMTFVIIETIVKGQVSVKYYVIKKSEVPSAYNFFLFLFAAMAIAFLGKLVYVLLR